jgi:hypothetical protein
VDFLKKHQIILTRSVGAVIILLTFVIHFWSTPKEGISANESAAANVARMEAHTSGNKNSSTVAKKNKSPYLEAFESKRAKQIEYLSIIAILIGIGFFGYSFIKKEE